MTRTAHRLVFLALLSPGWIHAASSPEEHKRAWEYVSKFDHTNVKDVIEEGAGWFFANKFKTKSGRYFAYEMANPDPGWLPGWAAVKSAKLNDVAWEALVQSRINKSWTAQCTADFEHYWAAHQKAREGLVERLAQAKVDPDVYGRIAALAKIAEEYVKTVSSEKGLLKLEHPYRYTGFHFGVAQALKAELDALGLGFRLSSYIHHGTVKSLAAHGRAWGKKEAEQESFCGLAMKHGTHRVYPLPNVVRKKTTRAAVRWPVDEAAVAKLGSDAKREALGDLTAPSIPTVSGTASDADLGKLQAFGAFTVTQLGKDTIVLTRVDEVPFGYDCEFTNRVKRIAPDGTVEYHQSCKGGGLKSVTDTITLVATSLPAEVKLARGDEVWGFAIIDSATTKVVQRTKAKEVFAGTVKGKLVYLTGAKRGGKTLAQW